MKTLKNNCGVCPSWLLKLTDNAFKDHVETIEVIWFLMLNIEILIYNCAVMNEKWWLVCLVDNNYIDLKVWLYQSSFYFLFSWHFPLTTWLSWYIISMSIPYFKYTSNRLEVHCLLALIFEDRAWIVRNAKKKKNHRWMKHWYTFSSFCALFTSWFLLPSWFLAYSYLLEANSTLH